MILPTVYSGLKVSHIQEGKRTVDTDDQCHGVHQTMQCYISCVIRR